jgi:hypothetical protein
VTASSQTRSVTGDPLIRVLGGALGHRFRDQVAPPANPEQAKDIHRDFDESAGLDWSCFGLVERHCFSRLPSFRTGLDL